MAVISYVGQGAFTSGTGALTVPVPTGYTAGQTFILAVESANEAVTTPTGWNLISSTGTGTAAAAGGVLIAAFWRIATASEASVTVADTGNHTTAQIFSFSGCDTTNPIHQVATGVQATAATIWTLPSTTTTIEDSAVLYVVGNDRDANSSNSSVSGVSWQNSPTANTLADNTTVSGAGGGIIAVFSNTIPTNINNYATISSTTSNTAAFLGIALRPTVLLLVDSLSRPILRTLPTSANWRSVAYGNGVFVTVVDGNSIAATSPDGVTWTQRTLPANTAWTSVAYGNGIFVTVAASTSIAATSPDGITWTQRTLPVSADWRSVAYGNSVFVVVSTTSSSIVVTSPDGITWTQRTLPTTTNLWSVAYGSGVFVSLAQANSVAFTSPDGITWTQRTLPVSANWLSVAYGNGTFVALGSGTSIALTSPDGITWTQRTLPASAAWRSLKYGNGLFLAVVTNSTIAATSPDGITWTLREMLSSYTWIEVEYGNSIFVAIAANSSIATKFAFDNKGNSSAIAALTTNAKGIELVNSKTGTDIVTLDSWVTTGDVAVAMAFRDGSATPPTTPGVEWTLLDSSGSGTSSSVLAYKKLLASGAQSSGTFTNASSLAVNVYRNMNPLAPIGNWSVNTGTGTTVALPAVTTTAKSYVANFAGHQSTNISWPTSGITDFVISQGDLPVSTNWTSVAYGNGLFVAINNSSTTAATSPDGITWTQRTLPVSAAWASVTYGNGVFVAVAANSSIAATSPDGITWTQRTLPVSAAWASVTYGNGVFVAVAANSSIAATSPDGITWTQRTLPVSANWGPVTYGNGTFVAVASSSAIAATSSDGITWTQRTLPATAVWVSVTYGNGTFVAVAFTNTIVATSLNGITWTQSALPIVASWQSVTYGNGLFVAVASGGTVAATSPDGNTWTQRTLPVTANWQSVAYGNGAFVAVADGNIKTSIIDFNSIVQRNSNIDATDAIVVYDSAGEVL